jgi:hypothetical protein
MISSVVEESTNYVLTLRYRQDTDPSYPQRTHVMFCDSFKEALDYLAATYHVFNVIDGVEIVLKP